MSNNKTESISNIIKVYSSWKAVQPDEMLQSNLIEQKLNPKFLKMKSSKKTLSKVSGQKKQINLIELKSKELIPQDYQQRVYQTETGTDKEEGNINFFKRKNTGSNYITRYKSLQSMAKRQSDQNKITITLASKELRKYSSSVSKNWRIKACSSGVYSPVKMSWAHSKHISLGQFCLSDKKQYTIFLKSMIKGDLEILSRHYQLDMDQFIFKIKRQQLLRKTRSINRCQIQE